MKSERNLTQGPILTSLLLFALPMMAGNLLQQVYNITDTLIVGRFIGTDALAAVGSAYTLMTFLTSVIIGLCMGSGVLWSKAYGAGNIQAMKKDIYLSFYLIGAVTLLIVGLIYPATDLILKLLQIPDAVYGLIRSYVRIIFAGMIFTFLFNFHAYSLRAVGDSKTPLYFLASSSLLNILLDLLAVIVLKMGVEGAAYATVAAQAFSGLGIALYVKKRIPLLRVDYVPGKSGWKDDRQEVTELSELGLEEVEISLADLKNVSPESISTPYWDFSRMQEIFINDLLTATQQSVMNFGILMIQGLVNTFGPSVMAAFAAAVKIDTLAYMPAQEFANAYSLFISQNYGAQKWDRIKIGSKRAILTSISFCMLVSALIFVFAKTFLCFFVDSSETVIIAEGISYLHIEGAMYFGIGFLFLWYGYFRAIERPQVSLVLTIVSLGTRVLLSYTLAPRTSLGVTAIWYSIPIGWILADVCGLVFYRKYRIGK